MADLAEGWLAQKRGDAAAAFAHASKARLLSLFVLYSCLSNSSIRQLYFYDTFQNLAKNGAWPAAHFLAGQACSAMAHMPAPSLSEACSIAKALDHLLRAAAVPGDKHWGSTSSSSKAKRSKAKAKSKVAVATPEPPLPPAVRFQAYQLWLALAAHNGLNSSEDFAAVVEKALQLDPNNGS